MFKNYAFLKASSTLVCGLALLVSVTLCGAQTSAPSTAKPITFVVPYGAGGSTDIMARVMAQYLPPISGQPAIVENRTGGGGIVGWGSVARAAPDGLTVLTNEISFPISAALLPASSIPFDPRAAFAHINIAASVPHVLVVHPSVPVSSLKEFIAYAKANPGKLNYGSGGNGTNTHMGAELFKSKAGIFSTHIPYRGGGPALLGVLAGDVQWMTTALPGAIPHIKSGKVKALMVTANERSSALPEIASAKELGLDMDMPFWLGFSVPAATPAAVQAKLHKDFTAVLALPEVKKRLGDMGFSVIASSSLDAKKLVEGDMQRWATLIKAAGIKPD